MKLIGFVIVALMSVLGACVQSERGGFGPETSAIVDIEVINRAACGRLPHYTEGSWIPSETAIEPLEVALLNQLIPALAQDAEFYGTTPYAPNDYYRRYAGVTYGGRALIAICGEARELYDDRHMDWRTQTIPYRDGGSMSFGAHYDPESQRIVYFEFGFVG